MKDDDVEDICELSPLQQGMLFHTLYAPESGIYVEQISFNLRGAVNLHTLERAWQMVVERHSALRTAFYWEELQKPLQVIYRRARLPVEHLDWRRCAPAERIAALEAYRRMEWKKGVDLARAPVLRLGLIQLEDQLAALVWTFHHAVLDGWSVQIVLREVTACYEALARGGAPALPRARSYAEYIAWLQKQDMRETERYWRRAFNGFEGSTPIAREHLQVDGDDSERYAEHQTWIEAPELATLRDFARHHQLTLNSLVQGAWALLLSRYGAGTDVVFGAVVSGRPSAMPDIEKMVGLFINSLPVRVAVDPDAPPVRWLQELQAQQFEARNHEFSPLLDVRQWIGLPAGGPVFDSVLVFENYPVATSPGAAAADAEVRHIERTNVPLTVLVVPGERLLVKVLYDRRCFDAPAIDSLGRHYRNVLASLAAGTASRLSDLAMLSADERLALLAAARGGGQSLALPAESLAALFEAQAAKTPQAPAFIDGDQTLSYEQLRERVDALVRRLDRLGLQSGQVAGVCLQRSFDAAAALLAVLKCGAVYLPLDPDYPQARLRYMLVDAGATLVVSTLRQVASLEAAGVAHLLVDGDDLPPESAPACPSQEGLGLAPAYAIYTSGSTGRPKGVIAGQAQVLNRLAWMWRDHPFAEGEVGCQRTPLSFVDSLWEMLGPLLRGVPTAIMSAEATRDPLRLVDELGRHGVTRLWLVPALLATLLESLPDLGKRLPRLCFWVTSGEALAPDLAERFAKAMPHATLYNLYGTSETWDAAWHDPARDGPYGAPTSIGRPLPNIQTHVLDARGNPQPVGVPGELCIAGVAVAAGYINAPELTAQKFSAVELAPGVVERVYRTGDLVRRRADGLIEYIGRIDRQLKLRGYRIDPGEIETLLRSHPAIGEAVVALRDPVGSEPRLVAYCTSRLPARPGLADLRAFLRTQLPEVMLPAALIFLDAMPLTPSGKIDRRALPDAVVDDALAVAEPSRPASPGEQKVLELWQELFGRQEIGLDIHFFNDLGGHSLQAIRLASRMREVLHVELPVRRLFEAPTIAAQAALIGTLAVPAAAAGPELRALAREQFRVTTDHEGPL